MAAVRSLVVLQVERLVIEVQKGTSVGQGVVNVVENPMSPHQEPVLEVGTHGKVLSIMGHKAWLFMGSNP